MTTSGRDTSGFGEPLPLPWLLRRVNQRYRVGVAERLGAAGLGELPQPGMWALMAIAVGVSEPNQLAVRMGVSKQAVSKLVDRLVGTDFVERAANDADRRRTDLRLTTRGRKAVRVIEAVVRDTEQKMAAELGPQSFAELTRMLEQLAGEER